MEKRILVLVVGFLFIGINGFAADGDLIVKGAVGIGTTTPGAKLDVQGGSLKVGGIFISHLTGTNPTCGLPGGGGIVMRKWTPKTCRDCPGCSCGGVCTTIGGWSSSPFTCQYSFDYYGLGCQLLTCTADTWTEVVCMWN